MGTLGPGPPRPRLAWASRGRCTLGGPARQLPEVPRHPNVHPCAAGARTAEGSSDPWARPCRPTGRDPDAQTPRHRTSEPERGCSPEPGLSAAPAGRLARTLPRALGAGPRHGGVRPEGFLPPLWDGALTVRRGWRSPWVGAELRPPTSPKTGLLALESRQPERAPFPGAPAAHGSPQPPSVLRSPTSHGAGTRTQPESRSPKPAAEEEKGASPRWGRHHGSAGRTGRLLVNHGEQGREAIGAPSVPAGRFPVSGTSGSRRNTLVSGAAAPSRTGGEALLRRSLLPSRGPPGLPQSNSNTCHPNTTADTYRAGPLALPPPGGGDGTGPEPLLPSLRPRPGPTVPRGIPGCTGAGWPVRAVVPSGPLGGRRPVLQELLQPVGRPPSGRLGSAGPFVTGGRSPAPGALWSRAA